MQNHFQTGLTWLFAHDYDEIVAQDCYSATDFPRLYNSKRYWELVQRISNLMGWQKTRSWMRGAVEEWPLIIWVPDLEVWKVLFHAVIREGKDLEEMVLKVMQLVCEKLQDQAARVDKKRQTLWERYRTLAATNAQKESNMHEWTEEQQQKAREMLGASTGGRILMPTPRLENLDEEAKFLISAGFILRYELKDELLIERWLWKDSQAGIPALVRTAGGWLAYGHFYNGPFKTAQDALQFILSERQKSIRNEILSRQNKLGYLEEVLSTLSTAGTA